MVIRGGGARPQARRMLDWAVVGSVVCTTVPAGPVRVIACSRFSSRLIWRQVMPVRRLRVGMAVGSGVAAR